MIPKEIRDLNGWELGQALEIYSRSFPAVETKPASMVITMLRDDKNYHLYGVVEESRVVGMALLYVLSDLQVGLLDYMAVARDYQGIGIGSMLLDYVLGDYRRYDPLSSGLLLEVQTESVADPKERSIRESRIKFYQKRGAKILSGVHYLLPPQQGSIPEETYLMMVPMRKINALSKEAVCQYIRAVYMKVYHYNRNDLLDVTASKMPASIELSNVFPKTLS